MLSRTVIDNCRAWLIKNASDPVRYLAYRDLVQPKPARAKLKELWGIIENDAQVIEIFSRQKKDGSWCSGGSWSLPPSYIPKSGYSPVSPKYVTTAWILPILGDMGFTVADARVKRACEYILSYQCKNGYIAEGDPGKYDVAAERLPNMPCRFAIVLIALGKVGAYCDERVQKAYDLLVQWQRDDGGWILQKHREERNWNRSCPYSTYHATFALYVSHNKEYRTNILKGLDFLVRNLSQKKEDEVQKFFYHGHHTINELLMFAEHGFSMREKPLKAIMEWLMSMYDAEKGYFVYSGKPITKYSRRMDGMDSRVAKYRLYHLIEHDWLTYYVTRITLELTRRGRNTGLC
jgi:hypothetical protein